MALTGISIKSTSTRTEREKAKKLKTLFHKGVN